MLWDFCPNLKWGEVSGLSEHIYEEVVKHHDATIVILCYHGYAFVEV